jgi:hypothetical protein
MAHKFLVNNQLKYAVLGIFGQTAVEMLDQLNDQEQELDEDTADEIASNGTEMFRLFETVPECNAYAQGIIDMMGNNDYAFLTGEQHKALFQQLTSAEYLGVVESEKKEAEEGMYDPAREEQQDQEPDAREVGMIAAVITHNLFNELRNHYNEGYMHALDAISCLATMFEKKYSEVTEWAEFLDRDEQAKKWGTSDWEEFVITWAWANKDNCFTNNQNSK